jgi:hypothetical protein
VVVVPPEKIAHWYAGPYPIWGPHCTVTRGEPLRGALPGDRTFKLTVQPPVILPELVFCPVHSPDLEQLRLSLGLSRQPYKNFHLTLAYK